MCKNRNLEQYVVRGNRFLANHSKKSKSQKCSKAKGMRRISSGENIGSIFLEEGEGIVGDTIRNTFKDVPRTISPRGDFRPMQNCGTCSRANDL